ncbi:unnamed protein product [Prunus armeniaca]
MDALEFQVTQHRWNLSGLCSIKIRDFGSHNVSPNIKAKFLEVQAEVSRKDPSKESNQRE